VQGRRSSYVMAIALLYWSICIFCWAYVLRYGGTSGLWAFLSFILATIGTIVSTPGTYLWGLIGAPEMRAWQGINVVLLGSDLFYFLALLGIALGSRRYWPIWAAGFQLLCVLTHAGPLIDHQTSPRVYRAIESLWILPLFASMVFGISRDRRIIIKTADQRHEGVSSAPARVELDRR